jgi:hypothetical protein
MLVYQRVIYWEDGRSRVTLPYIYIINKYCLSLGFLIVGLGILTPYCDAGYVGKNKEGENPYGPASFKHLINLVVKPLICMVFAAFCRSGGFEGWLFLCLSLSPCFCLSRWCWHRSLCDPTDIAVV